jgi:hypothetical protein
MTEEPISETPYQPQHIVRRPIPNGTAVLVLGICSVVLGCILVGLVLGIIGLVLAKKSRALYREHPDWYDDFGSLQAGFVLSIVGVCIGGLALIYYIFVFALVIANGGTAVETSGYTV